MLGPSCDLQPNSRFTCRVLTNRVVAFLLLEPEKNVSQKFSEITVAWARDKTPRESLFFGNNFPRNGSQLCDSRFGCSAAARFSLGEAICIIILQAMVLPLRKLIILVGADIYHRCQAPRRPSWSSHFLLQIIN